MNLIERMQAAPAAFDYAQMDDGAAIEAKAAAERYRARTETYIFDTGRDLIAIKDRLNHGLFLRWVEAELKMTPRSAQRFMSVAEVLGSKSDTLSYLPPTVLYEMASPTIPEPARNSVIERIEAGTAPAPEAIMNEMREAKEAARKRVAQEKEAARRAKLSPEERAAEDTRNKRRSSRAAAKEAEWRKERLDRKHAELARINRADEAANALLEKLGLDDAARFVSEFQDAHGIYGRFCRLVEIDLAQKTDPIGVQLENIYETGITSRRYYTLDDEDAARVEALADDIGRNGLREPLILRKRDPFCMQSYELIDGTYRYLALRQLGQTTAPAYIAPPLG